MTDPNKNKKDTISVIFHQKNDSPKYFEIKRSRVYLYFIGLPALAIISIVFGSLALINARPLNILSAYNENKERIQQNKDLKKISNEFNLLKEENKELLSELKILQGRNSTATSEETTTANDAKPTVNSPINLEVVNEITKCPPTNCANTDSAHTINLSMLSLFRPIQGQKDLTRPELINLSGFKVSPEKETLSFQFNIIPTNPENSKISGHIVTIMKNELGIQAYPLAVLSGNDFQINYSAGEPFATQRFRPVDASFLKPRKSGEYSFTVFIFAKNGDLLHYQTVKMPIKL